MKSRLYFIVWRVVHSMQGQARDTDGAWERVKPVTQAGRRRRRWLPRGAAAVVLLAGAGVVAWSLLSREEAGEEAVAREERSRPELILPGGERVELSRDRELQAIELPGLRVAPDSASGVTVFEGRGEVPPGGYHQLNVPKGCEYVMRLPDRSLVWINSESTFRFPLAFTGDSRVVYLEGEAYFEVTRDDRAPFRVVSGEKTVTVLGTRFNVSAYADDPTWHATLVQGQVSVSWRGIERVLQPALQCVIDNATGECTVVAVEPETYTSWMNEQVYFKGITLENIVKKLGRWYDFTIVYENEETRQMKFRGGINKNRPLEETLRNLEKTTNIEFVVNGKVITVRKVER
jgi:ferric-dicitrate binding protein FerR (iron transport regulator)